MLKMLRTISKSRRLSKEITIKSYVSIPIQSGYEVIKSAQITPMFANSELAAVFPNIVTALAPFAPTLSLELNTKELDSTFTLFYSLQAEAERKAVLAIGVLQDRLYGVFESKGFRWEDNSDILKDKVYSLFIEPPISTSLNSGLLKVRTDNLRFYMSILGVPVSAGSIKKLVNAMKMLTIDGVVTLRFRPLGLDHVRYIGPITHFGESVMNQWEVCVFVTLRCLIKKRLASLIANFENTYALTKISRVSVKQILQRDCGSFEITSNEQLAKLLEAFILDNNMTYYDKIKFLN